MLERVEFMVKCIIVLHDFMEEEHNGANECVVASHFGVGGLHFSIW